MHFCLKKNNIIIYIYYAEGRKHRDIANNVSVTFQS